MKRKYIAPQTEVIKMNVNHFLCYSAGLHSRQYDDDSWDDNENDW